MSLASVVDSSFSYVLPCALDRARKWTASTEVIAVPRRYAHSDWQAASSS